MVHVDDDNGLERRSANFGGNHNPANSRWSRPTWMDDRGPILVRAAVSEDTTSDGVSRVDETVQERRLNVVFSEEVLSVISENTGDLQEKLNNFVNAMDSRIQSVWIYLIWLMQVDIPRERDGADSSDTVVEDCCGGTALHRDVEAVDSGV
jgi:hypothetical protein